MTLVDRLASTERVELDDDSIVCFAPLAPERSLTRRISVRPATVTK